MSGWVDGWMVGDKDGREGGTTRCESSIAFLSKLNH